MELSSDRSFGMSVGPIPHSSIRRYAEFYYMNRDELDFFSRIIRAMDNEYLAIVNKPKDQVEMVPISDITSQHALFARLKARAGHKKR